MATDVQRAGKASSSVFLAKSVFERASLQGQDPKNEPPFKGTRISATVCLASRAVAAKDSFVHSVREKYESKTVRRVTALVPAILQRAASLDSTNLPTASCRTTQHSDTPALPDSSRRDSARQTPNRPLPCRRLKTDDSGIDEPPASESSFCCDSVAASKDAEKFRDIVEHLKSFTAVMECDSESEQLVATPESGHEKLMPFFNSASQSDTGPAGEPTEEPYKKIVATLTCCKSHSPLLQQVAKSLVDTLMALSSYRRKCAALEQAYRKCDQDLRSLQLEMSETKDRFSDDAAGDLAALQREIAALQRVNRTLQFKLKTADKRVQELEAGKTKLDEERRRWRQNSGSHSASISDALESELLALRDLVASAKSEATGSAEIRRFYEIEIDKLKRERGELQIENEKLKHADRVPQHSDLGDDRCATVADKLRVDLETSIERERDAKEQLQFAQDEIASLRRKLKEVEGDNEGLVHQVRRLASGKGLVANGDARGEHPAKSEVAAAVLDRHAGARARDEAQPLPPPQAAPSSASTSGSLALDVGSVYREAKYEAMNQELEDLRWQLAERDRIIAQAKARGSKPAPQLRKAVSLDSSGVSVDSCRQIDLMHQEAQVLRDKLMAAEADLERAVKENKKLLMLMSRKASGADRKAPSDAKEEIAALRNENAAVRQKLEMVLSGTQSGRLIDELESENSVLKTELAFYQKSRRLAKEQGY